jgi:hypothetical protein
LDRISAARLAEELCDAGVFFVMTDEQCAHYATMRRAGESPRLAIMLATGKPPAISTDDTFMAGRREGQVFRNSPGLHAHHQAIADRAGISTHGKTYMSGLAAYPGDPRAWVNGKSDVLAVARERNLTVEGCVSHKGHAVDPGSDKDVADDILEGSAMELVAAGMKPAEAVAKAYDLRTGRSDAGQPQLVDDYTPHPEDVCRADGDID